MRHTQSTSGAECAAAGAPLASGHARKCTELVFYYNTLLCYWLSPGFSGRPFFLSLSLSLSPSSHLVLLSLPAQGAPQAHFLARLGVRAAQWAGRSRGEGLALWRRRAGRQLFRAHHLRSGGKEIRKGWVRRGGEGTGGSNTPTPTPTHTHTHTHTTHAPCSSPQTCHGTCGSCAPPSTGRQRRCSRSGTSRT